VRNKILSRMMALILFLGMTGLSRADDDNRTIAKLGHNASMDRLRTASFYLVFKGNKSDSLAAVPSGNDARFYSEVWDGLYLQVNTESGERGITGYMFAFSKDEDGKSLVGTNESRDVPTLREVSVSDFRSDDNFSARPLKPGPGTTGDRGALRIIHYDNFDVEIRVLEFNIGDAGLKMKPYFKTVSCLVTVREKDPAGQAK
jgi:hypothetical protein